jgi:hypothetical protein
MTEINNTIMIRSKFFSLILVLSIFSNRTWSQADSLKVDKVSTPIWYFGFGGGANTRGGNLDLGFTMTSSGGMGGNVQLLLGYCKLENVPADYYNGLFRWITPADHFSALSFNFVKKFSTHAKFFRVGFEAGPSWIWYNFTELQINPNYPGLFEYKYNKIHTVKSSAGLSMAMKADFPFLSFFGYDLTFFGIINKLQSVVGLDICIDLGMVK